MRVSTLKNVFKYFIGTFLVLAFSITLYQVVSEEEARLDVGREPLTTILLPSTPTRATFNAGPISGRLCAADANGNCQWLSYAQAIGRMTIPALVLAPVSIIAFWAFCLGRCCCNCFGGIQRTPGNVCYGKTCCGDSCWPHEFSGYSAASIWVVRILYVVCFIALLAVMIPGFFGNAKVSKGITSPGQNFLSFADGIQAQAKGFLDRLSALPYTNTANGTFGEIVSKIQPLRDTGTTINQQINKAEQYRMPIFIVFLVLAPLCFGIGILGGFLNKWKLIFGCALVAFWMSLFIWLIFGIQYALLIVVNDTCNEMVLWNNNLANATVYIQAGVTPPKPQETSFIENLNSLVSCSQNSSFTDIANKIRTGQNQAYSTLCDPGALPQFCFNNDLLRANTTLLCSFSGTADQVDIVYHQPACVFLREYNNTGNFSDCIAAAQIALQGNFTVLDISTTNPPVCQALLLSSCPTKCYTSESRNTTAEVIGTLSVLEEYIQLFTDVLNSNLLNCLVFQPLASSLQVAVCDQLSGGGDLLEQAFLSIAIILIPGTILAILASKRWRADSFATGEMTGMGDYEMNTKANDMSMYDSALSTPNIIITAQSAQHSPEIGNDGPVGYSLESGVYVPEDPPAYKNPAYSPEGQDSIPSYSDAHRGSNSYNPHDSPDPERLDRHTPE